MSANEHTGTKGPVVLCILDGWGQSNERNHNAIALADTPNWDRLVGVWPTSLLDCAGENVGLPHGQMGNSEVGHLNLGAGRIVWQDLPRINGAISDGSIWRNADLVRFVETLKKTGGACHLIGLVSSGGVHSHLDHIVCLAEVVSKAAVPVHIHAILDGRDTPPESAVAYITQLSNAISCMEHVTISTLCGRYYAMDRDKRWDRVERAYNLLVTGTGEVFADPVAALKSSYDVGITDEFFEPARLADYSGMSDGDGVLHANFRADRVRELLDALLVPSFNGFVRKRVPELAAVLGMVAYSAALDRFCDAIFPPIPIVQTLGEVVDNANLRQLRLAETEKYAHVTYFFNGGREEPFIGEERLLVPSPKVATYDLKPEMSALEVTENLLNAIAGGQFDLIVVNYANGDMVGHTGKLDAAITAVECIDACVGRVEQALIESRGVMLLTADHGNCEKMFDPATGLPHTAHTLNPVPLVLINCTRDSFSLCRGRLADVAPTLLDLLDLSQPEEMTGKTLIS
ncbi:MAG: 2,3-bisphosphoglycerate-independent phosphoglycerate mutase [Hyphomicrobiaceae bacterium]